MTERKRDPEIDALEVIHAALKPLTEEGRTRVLASVYALLGMERVDATPSPRVQTAPALASSTSENPEAIFSASRRVGIAELVTEKRPTTHDQKIALFAYYRDKHEGNARFSRDDLKPYFGKAKEQPPQNYDRDFVKAVNKGWIHEDAAESYITSKGIEAVESGFQAETNGGKPKRARKGPSRKGASRRTARTKNTVTTREFRSKRARPAQKTASRKSSK